MAKLSTFKCDQCGKVKGETNHWLVMFLLPHRVEILPFSAPFDTGVEKPGAVHLCGSGCAMKKLADRLSRENAGWTRPERTENDVEYNCIRWLQAQGWIAERNPAGLFFTATGEGHRVGRPGVCDWRLKRSTNHPLHYFELECKKPGEKPSKVQREYMAQMAAHGVVAVYADSLEMLQRWYMAEVVTLAAV